MKKELLKLNNIRRTFDDGETILDNFNFTIYENEFVTLVGPSGCGKTTLLRLIGGFDLAQEGNIIFDNEDITKLPANKRHINTVFQKYALFPHLNVFENIAFGLRTSKEFVRVISQEEKDALSKEQLVQLKRDIKEENKLVEDKINKAVNDVLKLVRLDKHINKPIDKLSGGQQQRVAIARAIVNKPKVLLLDEPLAALDLKLRQEMQYELKDMQRKLGITFIFVTHDQEEALTMSDRVVVMNDGLIQQVGSPEDIYNEPINSFVANFIGESNIFEGIYKGNKKVSFLEDTLECVDTNFKENEKCLVVIRPEDFDIVDKSKSNISGIVDSYVFKGVHFELILDINGKEVILHTLEKKEIGETIYLSVDPYEIHLMKVNNE